MVCGICKNLLPRLLFKQADPTAHLMHHRNLAGLEASKSQKCYICTLLLSAIPPAISPLPDLHTRCYFDTFTQPRRIVVFEAVSIGLVVSNPLVFDINAEIFHPDRSPISGNKSKVSHQPVFEELYASSSSEQCIMPKERWDQIAAWLQVCQSQHSRCSIPSSTEVRYPTRLLDISEPQKIRLVETETLDENPPYATLGAICEGLSNTQLTASSAARLFEGVFDDDLSTIYKDAVTTARKLEIGYIWIESLCVIQDYTFDRQIESSFLADAYAGSALNISTTGSSTTSDTLFNPRTQRKVSFTLPVGTDMSFAPFQQPNFWLELGLIDTWEEKVEAYIAEQVQPLTQFDDARAQIAQIPRTVNFGRFQVSWSCLQLEATEGCLWGQKKVPEPGLSMFSHLRPLQTKTSFSIKFASPTGRSMQAFLTWLRLVETNSQHILAIENDPLSVIDGVATRFQPFIGDRYGMGHWEKYFMAQLLWRNRGRYNQPRLHNPGNQRAPSWSWASSHSAAGIELYHTRGEDILSSYDSKYGQRMLEVKYPSGPKVAGSGSQLGFLRLETPLALVRYPNGRHTWIFDNEDQQPGDYVMVPFHVGRRVGGILLAPVEDGLIRREFRRIGFVELSADERDQLPFIRRELVTSCASLPANLRCYESKRARVSGQNGRMHWVGVNVQRMLDDLSEKTKTPVEHYQQTLYTIKIV